MPSEERLENLVGWPSSPRISFSHDLSQSDISPAPAAIALRSDSSLPLDTDFDFSLSCEISAEDLPSSADELFSDGKLLPLPIKQRSSTSDPPPPPPPLPPPPLPPLGLEQRKKRGSLKEIMMASTQELVEEDRNEDDRDVGKRSFSRTFWRFGRSSSLGGSRSNSGGLTCPFPLYRSRSDGSNQYSNPTPTSKIRQFKRTTDNVTNNNNINNNSKSSSFRKASIDSATKAYYYSGSKKGAYGNGLRISPVINVPAPYLFSRGNGGTNTNGSSVFGYLLCSCSNKSMKRRAVTCSP